MPVAHAKASACGKTPEATKTESCTPWKAFAGLGHSTRTARPDRAFGPRDDGFTTTSRHCTSIPSLVLLSFLPPGMDPTEAVLTAARQTGIATSNVDGEVSASGGQQSPLQQQRRGPETYAQAIITYSTKSKEQSLYPGVNYRHLARFLEGSPYTKKPSPVPVVNQRPFYFAVVHELALPVADLKRVCRFDGNTDLTKFANHNRPAADSGQLIFLRGFPSAQWLKTVGARYRIDPEFFRRYMTFSRISDCFDLPALPSTSHNLLSLVFTSIGFSNSNLLKNENGLTIMEQHFRELGTISEVGESIVRRFSRHNEEHFTIEQRVSIYVIEKGPGWTILLMLDNGRDLSENTNASWASLFGNTRQLYDTFLPNIQFRPNIALTAFNDMGTGSGKENMSTLPISRTSQSASMLHTKLYGRFLDQPTMNVDAFYALNGIFAFAASSENQFLNLVQSVLDTEGQRFEDEAHREKSLLTLKFHKRLLDDHVQQIRQTITAIHRRGSGDWPKAKDPKQVLEAERAALALLEDFENLLRRLQTLSQQFSASMDDLRNSVVLSESRKAMKQQFSVGRLTTLAFFFIPLSFTSSFFGMNFNELGGLSLWVYFVASFPVFASALVVCFWDIIHLGLLSFLRIGRT